ncbi:MAG: metallophosphoesterase family protein [Clostridia bacterium]|nr:metallophosphoesterase family protein [Clostridia bacterium]
MKIALISDIHANVTALEAILKDIKQQGADRIISLGDQINLGPSPRETLDLLAENHVKCLDGNHERYVRAVMDGKSGYEGANFDTLRYTAERIKRDELNLPEAEQIGSLLFCHALPGMDTFPVYDPERAVPQLRGMHFDGIRHIICGHGHNPTQIRTKDLTVDSIGSSGCMDAGAPGTAMYTMLWLYEDTVVLRPQMVSYDMHRVCRLFLDTGMAEIYPIMSRIICQQMTINRSWLVPFVGLAAEIAKEQHAAFITQEILRLTDAAFPWPDGMNTKVYWETIRHDVMAD